MRSILDVGIFQVALGIIYIANISWGFQGCRQALFFGTFNDLVELFETVFLLGLAQLWLSVLVLYQLLHLVRRAALVDHIRIVRRQKPYNILWHIHAYMSSLVSFAAVYRLCGRCLWLKKSHDILNSSSRRFYLFKLWNGWLHVFGKFDVHPHNWIFSWASWVPFALPSKDSSLFAAVRTPDILCWRL